MKTTVAIPTDFSIESLNTLRLFLNSYTTKGRSYNIILLHGYTLPGGIQDLLFFSKDKTLKTLSGEDFKEACMMIQNKFASKINTIQTDLFTGYTHNAFTHYIEGNNISEIYFNSSIQLKETSKSSFDLTKYIQKSKATLIDVSGIAETETKHADEKVMSAILNNSMVFNK